MSARRGRTPLAVLLTSAAFSVAGSVHAASPEECIASHEDGQRLRREGRLLAAREHFLACAAEACPAMVRKDCVAFEDEVEAQVPTVVLALSDAEGRDVRDASVTVDGATPVTLDGRDVALDPGAHRFAFTTPAGQTRELTVVLREGEKLRRVVATLPPEVEKKPSTGYLPVPTLAYVLGGVGVAALGSFTYFAISGKSKQDDLEAHCAPHCTESQVDAMRTRYLIADISLATGIVALGVGAYVFFADPFGERKARHASERQSRMSLQWSVGVAPGLGAAMVRGRF